MEQSEENGKGKEKKVVDSSSNAEQSQAEKDDIGPVEQNLTDPKLRRMFSNRLSAQRSRQKKVKFIEELEERTKILQDQLAQLEPQRAFHQNLMHRLMVEEQTLFHEIEYLQEKALLRDAEDEKNRKKKNMLKELRDIKQDQLLNLDIDPLSGASVDTSYQVAGDGAQSSYIVPEPRQTEIAAVGVADRNERMDQMNLARATTPSPNPNPNPNP